MSPETFASILFGFISFSWVVYLTQELFITGSSALNRVVSSNEGERRQVQVAAGIHWDGIEVWLIASLTLTFAVFPLAFTTTLTYLYVPFFLLIFAIIGRGIAIEMIYKLDSKRWVKNTVLMWTISSILIFFILGVYISNLFLGLPIAYDSVTGVVTQEAGFMSIFNVTGISGGLLFLSLSLIGGSGWISLSTEGELGKKAFNFIKKTGIIYTAPVFLMLVFMGFNNTDSSIFIGELFTKAPVLFALPAITVLLALLTTLFAYKEDSLKTFIFSLSTMGVFLITGFIGRFPYMVASKIDPDLGIRTIDAMVSAKTMNVVLVALCIFYPIIIGYQTWKYINFTKKVKFNDE